MKRLLDILLCLIIIPVALPLAILVALAVRVSSVGPVLYWSDRVGRDEKLFSMPKFRSMKHGTPAVATHLLQNPASHLTPIGSFLRKSSLDEIPQLWCILRGEMSFVGPRPALFNQTDLVAARREAGVASLTPGLTGWAQINGRDELAVSEKVKFDLEYKNRQSMIFDLKIMFLTFVKVIKRDGITH